MEQGQPDPELDQFRLGELRLDLRLLFHRWAAIGGEERVGEHERCFDPRLERRVGMGVIDLRGGRLVEPLLLRDREADVTSIPAIGDARIA